MRRGGSRCRGGRFCGCLTWHKGWLVRRWWHRGRNFGWRNSRLTSRFISGVKGRQLCRYRARNSTGLVSGCRCRLTGWHLCGYRRWTKCRGIGHRKLSWNMCGRTSRLRCGCCSRPDCRCICRIHARLDSRNAARSMRGAGCWCMRWRMRWHKRWLVGRRWQSGRHISRPGCWLTGWCRGRSAGWCNGW